MANRDADGNELSDDDYELPTELQLKWQCHTAKQMWKKMEEKEAEDRRLADRNWWLEQESRLDSIIVLLKKMFMVMVTMLLIEILKVMKQTADTSGMARCQKF